MVGVVALKDRSPATLLPLYMAYTAYQLLAAAEPVSSPFAPEVVVAIVTLKAGRIVPAQAVFRATAILAERLIAVDDATCIFSPLKTPGTAQLVEICPLK